MVSIDFFAVEVQNRVETIKLEGGKKKSEKIIRNKNILIFFVKLHETFASATFFLINFSRK